MLKSGITISLLFVISFGISQELLQGNILNNETNEPILGVNIQIGNSITGATTDEFGAFRMVVNQWPVVLLISHIGFEDKRLTIEALPKEVVTIYLTPTISVLDEVVVTAENKLETLSEVNQYSLKDFEIARDQIVRLEYHGTFEKERLTLTDLEGKKISHIELDKIRATEGLFKSCADRVYLITRDYAYLINVGEIIIGLDKKIGIDTLNRFIKPCKVRYEDYLYYIIEKHNGLQRTVLEFNTLTAEDKVLEVVGDDNVIANYKTDLGLMKEGQQISNIMTNNVAENEKIRGLQNQSDFLTKIFYKPEYPVNVCRQSDKVLIFNHPEMRLLIYNDHQIETERRIPYVEDKKWLKKLLQDESSEEIYGLFDHQKGTQINKISVDTGLTEIVGIIPGAKYTLGKIKIYKNWVYYTRERLSKNGPGMELVKQRI
jgi:hypothetical protein